jgi:dihydroorotate dehydrogenase (fumarate)
VANLKTRWLGLDLSNPFIVGASPLSDTEEGARRLEEAGAAAIVMRSLFEEQLESDGPPSMPIGDIAILDDPCPPAAEEFALNPAEYIDLLARLKKAVRIPVVGSLNGTSFGPWLEQARAIERAGADALELNLYAVSTDPWDPPQVIERRSVEIVRAVRSLVRIPVGVKLSPYYTSVPHFAQQLELAGADGVVLFNRFYQPDVDIEKRGIVRSMRLSDPSELLVRLHETAILSGRLKGSIAVSGGVHSAVDALKAMACGAHAVQVVSVLLKQGAGHLRRLRESLDAWMDRHEVASLDEFRGCMSLLRCPDPRAWERANYMRILQSWRPDFSGGRVS